ncbi:MAG TPA: filamentous hemagglutinin N-terminal domain-containing protein, partial [Nevskiaceae bacterium]|nr:filamentous hemagglutinin N-terminal domain-containing protein [Nevskiaceae bacterium]
MPPRKTPRRVDGPFRLSAVGVLRRYVLASSLGLSAVTGTATAGGPAFGSAAWLAIKNAQTAAVQTPGGAPSRGVAGAVTTAGAAQQQSTRTVQDLGRAADAIVAAQNAQAAARDQLQQQPTSVPDGLGAGGLQAAAGAAQNVAAPASCAATNTCVWQNAALPTQSVANGQTTVTVTQNAQKAILTWDSFNVGAHTTLNFDQSAGRQADGSNNWVALNRIGGDIAPSQILGQIKADGSVYLINPNGFIFGGTSTVNVHTLVATSLPMFSSNTTTSNGVFLNQGIQGSGVTTLLGLAGDQQIASASQLPAASAITIDEGAQISTGELGFSLIAAPQVINHGTIQADQGQVILAAALGVSQAAVSVGASTGGANNLNPVLTGRYIVQGPGGPTDVTPVTSLVNDGLIEASRGNVTLLGHDVTQSGVVVATTSITNAGSIALAAQDELSITDKAVARTGSLVLAADSVTALLPEHDGETTTTNAAADAAFQRGSISAKGSAITVNAGALIEAPGENVSLAAIAQDAGQVHPLIGDGSIAGRLYVDSGATIDVAGLADIELPASSLLVTIPRLGQNELADSPLQRNGFLFGQSVVIDSRDTGTRSDGTTWNGTPLANLSGYVEQRARNIDQMLQNAGNIGLAGNEVIVRSGSLLNLNGGYLHYLGGYLQTTQLIAADGSLVPVAGADPYRTYLGIAGVYTQSHPRWNVTSTFVDPLASGAGTYQSDYVQGGSAGTLSIFGQTTALLNGDINAHAFAGQDQVGRGQMPSGGKFFAGAGSALSAIFPDPTLLQHGPSYVLESGVPDVGQLVAGFDAKTALPDPGSVITDSSNYLHWTPIASQQLTGAGFSSVTVAADDAGASNLGGEIRVEQGGALTVQPGGSISLTGSRVVVLDDLVARAGSIKVVATGQTGLVGTTVQAGSSASAPTSGDVVVGDGVALNASGLWVNDTGLDADQITGGAYINGGSISLQTLQNAVVTTAKVAGCAAPCVLDTTGSILLSSGSLLDVSSGGRVQRNGKFVESDGVLQARGGNISLQIYGLRNGKQFGSDVLPLPSAKPPQHGTLQLDGSLRGYGFSGGGTLAIQALGLQIGGTSAASWNLNLAPEFFAGQGFGAYTLSAEYDATIGAGTVLNPVQSNLIPDRELLSLAATGTDLYGHAQADPGRGYTTIGTLDAYHRQATSQSISAGDYLNWRLPGQDSTNPPDYRAAGITGTLLLDHGAVIQTDAGASVTLGSMNQLTIDGSIIDHGGNVTLTADTAGGGYAQLANALAAYSSNSKSVWLGADSLIDVSGISILNPYASVIAQGANLVQSRTGRLYGGGNVTISNDTGYVVAVGCKEIACDVLQHGAIIDVRGSNDAYDLRTDSGGYARTPVWSDGGGITIGAAAGLYFDAALHGDGGAASANGGSLTVTAENALPVTPASGFGGATQMVLSQQSPVFTAGALTPGQNVEVTKGVPAGIVRFSADVLDGSGITSLQLGSDPVFDRTSAPAPITVSGNVDLALGRSIVINTTSLIAAPLDASGSHLDLSAPYVALHGYVPGGDYPKLPVLTAPAAGTQLAVQAQDIDLGGQLSLRNFADASFVSSDDLRFVTPSRDANYFSSNVLDPSQTVPGILATAGNLEFQAARIYPASGNAYIIDAVGALTAGSGARAETTVSFLGNGQSATAATPLSAGGSLLVDATHIIQSGNLRAPSGQIVLGVTDANDAVTQGLFGYTDSDPSGSARFVPLPLVSTASVDLAAGSITSVSLDGLTVPYGQTVDGQNWQYNPAAAGVPGATSSLPDLTAPPGKQITLGGAAINMASGSIVDLSGGGDLQGQEFVPGSGGTRDVLSQFQNSFGTSAPVPLYPDSRMVYAVIPGYRGLAAYDPSIVAGSPLVGRSVYLSGGHGLPAGIYVLLPGKYATLPGAFRVVQDTRVADAAAAQNAVLADGTQVIAGRFVDAFSGSSSARSTAFLVQAAPAWQLYSQYNLTSANQYFSDFAQSSGTAIPLLATDAGHLVLAASSTLSLQGTVDTVPATGGIGAEVDIAATRLAITAGGTAAAPGFVALDVNQLDQLQASSLLLGGTRTRTASGDLITALATDVVASNGDTALSAPEIMLVSKAGGGGIRVDAGSVIAAQGSIAANADVPIQIGSLPSSGSGVSGDGSLLRVSNGADVIVNRVNVPGIDAAGTATGSLTLAAGAVVRADQSVTLDSTGSTAVDRTATFSARSISADAASVSFVSGTDPAATGLVVGADLLAQFASAEQITLSSRGAMDFIGGVDLQVAQNLALNAAAFRTSGGDVSLDAATLTLGNALHGAGSGSNAGTHQLDLHATQLVFGDGSASLDGFGQVNAVATRSTELRGQGRFDFGSAAVDLTTSLLSAAAGADHTLATTAAFSVSGTPAAGTAAAGGALRLQGGSLSVDTRLQSLGGVIDLHASTGDVALGSSAQLSVAGTAQPFYDVTSYGSAGTIDLTSDQGSVTASAGSLLDFGSASGGGNAGRLNVRARQGAAMLNGTLRGMGADAGGSFGLDTGGAIDLNALASQLAADGINQQIDLHSRSGNLQLSTGHVLAAASVSLTADGSDSSSGMVQVDGTIDASGSSGGQIAL